jgi:hypothetical protein
MEQHPIPQQISSYQFRLVGDMTLKQFFQLAGGALISLLFYASPLHPLIKWPLIILFALLGVALAFLPFEERPLEKWIIAFFRSIYSPTLFSWQQPQAKPVFFQEEAPAPTGGIIAPGGEKALQAYLSATPQRTPFLSALEAAEQSFLSKVTQLFGGGYTPRPIAPAPSMQAAPKKAKRPEVEIPSLKPTPLNEPLLRPKVVVEEKQAEVAGIAPQLRTTGVGQVWGSKGALAGEAAQFSPEAAPPLPPTTPNTIVGQILDEKGKIVDGAIMEIRDVAGRPVRALKTNKLGHFMIVTPLVNGRYEVLIDKEGYSFDPIVFTTEGEIIPPIIIKARTRPQAVTAEASGVTPATL